MFVFEQLELPWREIKGMTINMPPNVSRKKTGLMDRVGKKLYRTNLSFSFYFFASSTRGYIVEEFKHDYKSCVQL
jgi:hypothetical protein